MSGKLAKAEEERFQVLLMSALDDELSPEERKLFDHYITSYPQCRKEWEEYQKLKEVTKTMKFRNPPDATWDNYWLNVYNRIERSVAWVLISLGIVILLTFVSYNIVEAILFSSDIPIILRVGIISLIAGAVILLVSVVREQFISRKSDPYKEVKR